MLIVVPGSELPRHQALKERAFRFRHAILVRERGWTHLGGSEGGDRFDDEGAVHQICLRDAEISNHQRPLPTARPNLLIEVFAELRRECPPTSPGVWPINPGHLVFRTRECGRRRSAIVNVARRNQ